VKGAPFPASRPSAAPLGLARPFWARRPASPHPSLSRGIKMRRPLAARPLLFCFPSHTGHPPRSCSGLRPSSFIDHRRSSIAVSRLRMRHRHPRSRVIIGLRSLDRSSLALVRHCLSPQKPSSEQQNRALLSLSLSLSQKLLAVSTLFASAQPNRRWFVLRAS